MKKTAIFGLFIALVFGLMGLGLPIQAQAAPSATSANQTYTVVVGAEKVSHGITVQAYFPATLHIHVGDTVLWKQNSHEIHTVTFLAGAALPELLVPVPNGPAGALMLNPQVAFPTAPADGLYDGTTYANSGVMSTDPGQPNQFSLTFTQAGTYEYVCVVHGVDMSGKIVVEDTSTSIPIPSLVSARANVQMHKMLKRGMVVWSKGKSQIKPPQKNADGTTTYFVTVGYHQGKFDIMYFYPKQLTVHQGDTVQWDFSAMNMAPHTITFLNGAEEPELFTAVPQPDGPPLLVINPDVALPQNTDQPLTRTGIYNSGLIDPAAPHSFALKIGNVTGTINYLCLLHDASGMVGSLVVMP
ncbi:MAG: plastocyanin/azurin family copper-binding protein [Anaerolineales bacterium]|jgi:plastocyanin